MLDQNLQSRNNVLLLCLIANKDCLFQSVCGYRRFHSFVVVLNTTFSFDPKVRIPGMIFFMVNFNTSAISGEVIMGSGRVER